MGLVTKRTVSAVDFQREHRARLTRGASFGCALLQSSETTHRVLTAGLDVLNALSVAVEPADYDKQYKKDVGGQRLPSRTERRGEQDSQEQRSSVTAPHILSPQWSHRTNRRVGMLWLWKACSFALASCDPRVRKTGAAGGVGLLRDCETDVDPPLDCECECSGQQ